MSTIATPAPRSEPWPVWAKLLVVLMTLLAVIVALPSLVMWGAMATGCMPMMSNMQQMLDLMRPGMMR